MGQQRRSGGGYHWQHLFPHGKRHVRRALSNGFRQNGDYGNAFVKLSTANNTLK
jgi:hypothetical protein